MTSSAVYLDHAATTPMSATALEAYMTQLSQTGNPSSLHAAGRAARRVVEEARESIAANLGARPSEVIFTSGGTEANNLAIKGVAWGQKQRDPGRNTLMVSAIEHHAVLDPVLWMSEHSATDVVLLPVDSDGVLVVSELAERLHAKSERTALISVMWANNEVGAVQPIADVTECAAKHGVLVHSDAVQALGHIDVNFADSGLNLMTISGHKIGAPVGVGALIAHRDTPITPVLHGGGQERTVRSGTVDAAAIHAFAVAVNEVVQRRKEHVHQMSALQRTLIKGVRERINDAQLQGPDPASGKRLSANVHFTFPGCEGDSLLYLLDSAGIQCSTGSACQAGIPQPSHVLIAMGMEENAARGALRFSMGHTTSEADIDRLLAALPLAVDRARQAGLSSHSG